MYPLFLNRFFKHTNKTPALGLAVRATLRDLNEVADTGLITLIVNTQFRPALHIFAIFRMLDFLVNSNLNALIAAVAYHHGGHSV